MKLENIVPWGRSYDEYRSIFSLSNADLKQSILSCGDGPSSFNSTLTALGGEVVSIDPTYCFNAYQLKSRIAEVYEEVMPQMQESQANYIWERIPSVEALGRIRMSAMDAFLSDYDEGKEEGRYIDTSLPNLAFSDEQFDLALCSHYLFLYSEQVSLEEHIESLIELCRVAKEVRVYPLLSLDGEVSPHLSAVRFILDELGLMTSLVDVEYQFQKGATKMLVVKPEAVNDIPEAENEA